jgi:4-carboxymuconolactone decarboxylase
MVDRKEGARIRREVLGAEYVDAGRKRAEGDPLGEAFIEFTEEFCWGNVWVRPGLPRKTRSMLNIAMLTAMARWHELEVHVRGAIANGVTKDEVKEILLQAGVYAGVPVAAEGFRIARAVFAECERAEA